MKQNRWKQDVLPKPNFGWDLTAPGAYTRDGWRGVRTRRPLSSRQHPIQNTENECHQWLSDSFRVHQIRFRLGSTPDPARGAYSTLQTPNWFKGAILLRGREEKEREGKVRVWGEGKGTGGRGRIKGNGTAPWRIFLDAPLQRLIYTTPLCQFPHTSVNGTFSTTRLYRVLKEHRELSRHICKVVTRRALSNIYPWRNAAHNAINTHTCGNSDVILYTTVSARRHVGGMHVTAV